MTDALYRDRAAEELPRFRIRESRDRRALDALMSEDRAYAVYALGHLERGLFERSHFWVAEGSYGAGMVVHATAMGSTMFVAGAPVAVDAILSLHPGPRAGYLTTAAPEHLPVLQRSHRVVDVLHMQRMSVTRAGFLPATTTARRLRGSDVRELNALYALDGAPSYYTASHLENGVYFGAYDGGRLVSVAGTHIVAPNMAVGVVGNVFTHPAHRGRGLATAVTSRVTAALLDGGCALVALTVDPANTPAVRAYRRLGYEPGAAVVEARLRRRAPLGLGAWLRRRAARSGQRGRMGEVEEQAPGRPLQSTTDDGGFGGRDEGAHA